MVLNENILYNENTHVFEETWAGFWSSYMEIFSKLRSQNISRYEA